MTSKNENDEGASNEVSISQILALDEQLKWGSTDVGK